MSPFFEKIREYHRKGYYSAAMVERLTLAGALTEEEKALILGE